jgi:hypothetical protein
VSLATLTALADDNQFDKEHLEKARGELDINPERPDPATA